MRLWRSFDMNSETHACVFHFISFWSQGTKKPNLVSSSRKDVFKYTHLTR